MRIKKWEIVYWTGAICMFYSILIEDLAVLLGGLLMLLLGTIKGLTGR